MKAGDELLSTVFSKDHRYVIPIFQRPYVWNETENWVPLWQDIRKAAEEVEAASANGDETEVQEYFLGAFVTQHRSPVPKRKPTSMVIDGQQRMSTLQVFLAAARRVAVDFEAWEAADNFSALTRNRVSGDSDFPEDRHKVVPLAHDRAAYEWAVRGPEDDRPAPAREHRLARAAQWFESTIRDWVSEATEPAGRLDLLHFAVENRVKVVSIFLDAKDDPQVIFEALNHRGVRLDAADLVKNLLFQTLDRQGNRHREEMLLRDHWAVLDDQAWRAVVTTGRIKRVRVDTLLAYWLSAQRGEESSVEHLFEDLKRWMRSTEADAESVIRSIRVYADTMDRLQSLPMSDPVAQVVDRLEATKTTTAWPLLLFLHASDNDVPPDQAARGAHAIDSFLMRRAVCRLTTKDYNRLFGALLGDVKRSDRSVAGDVLVSSLASQTAGSRYWPDDSAFIDGLRNSSLFKDIPRPRLRALLVGLENQLLTAKAESSVPYRSATKSLTIEHVMPIHWEEDWGLPKDATEEEHAGRAAAVHSLGNLTLATKSLNSSLSNDPWSKKRHTLQTHSLARLTTASILTFPEGATGWTQDAWADSWDEERIALRGLWLIRLALRAWPREGAVPPEVAQDAEATSKTAEEGWATSRSSRPSSHGRTRDNHEIHGDLLPLVSRGLVIPGDVLRHVKTRTGQVFEAQVTPLGGLSTSAGQYRAPSPALSKLVGSSRNGWKDWTHVRTGKTLAELRDMLRDNLREEAD